MKGQITLFVIIGILIISLAGTVYYFRDEISGRSASSEQATLNSVAKELRPVESYFLDCLKLNARNALDTAGSQAGYIDLPADEPSSDYMPFSNKLDFLGMKIPYWWYISGNNIVMSNVPKQSDIEKNIKSYIEKNIGDCSLNSFFASGFDISEDNKTTASVFIRDNYVDFEISKKISISINDAKATVEKHKFRIPISLGKMYKNALAVYDAEQKGLFLENYSVDVMALYAPLSGFELSCAPKFWNEQDVSNQIKNALEANIAFLKLKGNYYNLAKSENKYFVQDIPSESGILVNFLYNKNWPSKIEIVPSENNIMKASPVGEQAGIGALGFCIVPYHFVYTMAYPVLIQFYDAKENYIFQFPVVVSVLNNKPRGAEFSSALTEENEICNRKIQTQTVNVMDINNNPVEAKISFKCLDTICEMGNAEFSKYGSTLITEFPQCVNGLIIAEANSYAISKQTISTNEAGIINMIMEPLHELNVDVAEAENTKVVIIANTNNYAETLTWPEQTKIKLKQGEYSVKMWLLKNGTFKLASQQTEQCIKVPAGGMAGLLGQEQEQCFDLSVPEIDLEELPVGGAEFNWTVTDDELLSSDKITFYPNTWSIPKTQEELIQSYSTIESSASAMPVLS